MGIGSLGVGDASLSLLFASSVPAAAAGPTKGRHGEGAFAHDGFLRLVELLIISICS